MSMSLCKGTSCNPAMADAAELLEKQSKKIADLKRERKELRMELLKAREQTTAKEDWDGLYQCNKCGGSLGCIKSFKYCPWCGKAVKWNG